MTKLIPLSLLIWNLFLAFVLGACGLQDEGPDDPGRGSAAVTVVAQSDLGALDAAPAIRGRDGGFSALIDGRSVWLFGDTFLDMPDMNSRTLISNTWSWSEDLEAEDGISSFTEQEDAVGAPTEFFPQTEEEWAFNQTHLGEDCQIEPCGARWALWPGPLVYDPERRRSLVFYHKIYAEPGAFNFYSVGHSIAVWGRIDDMPLRPVFQPEAAYPTLLFQNNEPAFGSAAVAVDDMLYVFGCENVGWVKPIKVARVPLADVLDRSAWRFFAGDDRWVSDVNQARTVFHGNDMMTVSYLPFRDVYLSTYSQPLDTQVMIRTAPRPEGPWSGPVVAFRALAPSDPESWVYDALAHPEYERDQGRIQYVSYSRQTGFLRFEVRIVKLELE